MIGTDTPTCNKSPVARKISRTSLLRFHSKRHLANGMRIIVLASSDIIANSGSTPWLIVLKVSKCDGVIMSCGDAMAVF